MERDVGMRRRRRQEEEYDGRECKKRREERRGIEKEQERLERKGPVERERERGQEWRVKLWAHRENGERFIGLIKQMVQAASIVLIVLIVCAMGY